MSKTILIDWRSLAQMTGDLALLWDASLGQHADELTRWRCRMAHN
jgi:hypothetical protein